MTIDLKDLSKAKVLAALYNASKPQGMGFIQYDPKPMTESEAEKLLQRGADFDYLQGRVMKVDLSGDQFDPYLYDRDNGPGAAKAALESLVNTGKENSPAIRKAHADRTFLSAMSAEKAIEEESQFAFTPDGTPVLNLGLGDMKEELEPKIKKAKKKFGRK